ncbi:MAG: ABC transporter permease, partial [Firmicutes bacterium]|nr:ABC transporter permease [Bacillota bacterium]
MNFNLAGLIKAAVLNGTPLLFGTSGEILTQKSGNMNLGVEGLMFMGGAFGLAGAFWYDQLAGASASGFLAVVIAL